MAIQSKSVMMAIVILGIALVPAVAYGGTIWYEPVKVEYGISSSQAEATPSLSPDGNTMYFASDGRSGGAGSFDICQATRDGSGGWNAPMLVPGINTAGLEAGPYVSPDGMTLYFDSSGLGGSGGRDIFFSTWTGSGWGTPVNLGTNVNSANDDVGPCISPDGLTLCFSSGISSLRKIRQCTRATISDPWGTPDEAPFVRLNTTGYRDEVPCVTLDGRVLYFQRRANSSSLSRMWRSEWDDVGSVWDWPTELIVGATNKHQAAPFLWTENRTLVFSQHDSGVWNIYEAQAVPEPSSVVLLGIGLAVFACRAWRRRKKR